MQTTARNTSIRAIWIHSILNLDPRVDAAVAAQPTAVAALPRRAAAARDGAARVAPRHLAALGAEGVAAHVAARDAAALVAAAQLLEALVARSRRFAARLAHILRAK